MKKKRRSGTVHYRVHALDRSAWKKDTICGASKGTWIRDEVTCRLCLRYLVWDVERYRAACADPLLLELDDERHQG